MIGDTIQINRSQLKNWQNQVHPADDQPNIFLVPFSVLLRKIRRCGRMVHWSPWQMATLPDCQLSSLPPLRPATQLFTAQTQIHKNTQLHKCKVSYCIYCPFKMVVYKEAFSNVQHGEIGGLNMVICVIVFVYL